VTAKETFLIWIIVLTVNLVAAIAIWVAAGAAGFLIPD
jgi:hypothetical protein